MIKNLHSGHASRIAKLLDLKLVLDPHNLLGCWSVVSVEDKTARQQFVDYRDVNFLITNCHVLDVLLRLGWGGSLERVLLHDEVVEAAPKGPDVDCLGDLAAAGVELRWLREQLGSGKRQVAGEILSLE